MLELRSGQMQNKDYFTDLFNKVNKNTQQNIKTSYIGKIVQLTLPTCSVQPLAMINGKKLPMVEDVNFITIPLQYKFNLNFNNNYIDTIGKNEEPTQRSLNINHKNQQVVDKKLNYQAGDVVLVDILDLDNSYFQGKSKFNVGSTRRHSMDYSVIVGKIADKNDFQFKN